MQLTQLFKALGFVSFFSTNLLSISKDSKTKHLKSQSVSDYGNNKKFESAYNQDLINLPTTRQSQDKEEQITSFIKTNRELLANLSLESKLDTDLIMKANERLSRLTANKVIFGKSAYCEELSQLFVVSLEQFNQKKEYNLRGSSEQIGLFEYHKINHNLSLRGNILNRENLKDYYQARNIPLVYLSQTHKEIFTYHNEIIEGQKIFVKILSHIANDTNADIGKKIASKFAKEICDFSLSEKSCYLQTDRNIKAFIEVRLDNLLQKLDLIKTNEQIYFFPSLKHTLAIHKNNDLSFIIFDNANLGLLYLKSSLELYNYLSDYYEQDLTRGSSALGFKRNIAQDYNDVHHSDILFYAARGNYPSIVNTLIPHIRKPAQNNPALYIAAEYGYLNIVDILLKNGADPNEISNDGTTAITMAVTNNHNEIVLKLLEYDANPNFIDSYENTALSVAVLNQNYEISQLLLKYGADPNSKGMYKDPILTMAYSSQNNDIIKLLVNFGAKIDEIEDIYSKITSLTQDDTRLIVKLPKSSLKSQDEIETPNWTNRITEELDSFKCTLKT